MPNLTRLPGARLVLHLVAVFAVWLLLTWLTNNVDELTNYYIALAAMYATAMFGMVILVGLSGQVSLGNGALMAVGAYCFAVVSLNWQTVPIIGVPMNGWWAMVFAAIGGIVAGLIIGGLGARLKGPYLAGLTLGIAVGVPAIANRFPELLGGETGLQLTVPYPDGGYAAIDGGAEEGSVGSEVTTDFATELPSDVPTEGAGAGETVDPGDLLTIEDLGGGALGDSASPVPSESASETLTPSEVPSVGDTGSTDIGVDGTDVTGTDSGGDLINGISIEHWQAGMSILVACLVLFLALNLVRGRQGSIWKAVRDDPVAAAVSGISPAWAKVGAFVVSSFFAALSGGVFAQILAYVGPGAFGLGLSLSLLVGIVLGGRSALLGAAIGALVLVWLPVYINDLSGDRGWSEQVTNNMSNLVYGLLVVLVVLLAPGGIVGSLQAGIGRVRRRRTP